MDCKIRMRSEKHRGWWSFVVIMCVHIETHTVGLTTRSLWGVNKYNGWCRLYAVGTCTVRVPLPQHLSRKPLRYFLYIALGLLRICLNRSHSDSGPTKALMCVISETTLVGWTNWRWPMLAAVVCRKELTFWQRPTLVTVLLGLCLYVETG